MLYRGRLAVMVDVIKVIRENGRLRPTHIMYKANLSHKLLKECLHSLTENGFLQETIDNGNTYFIVTKKGEEFAFEFSKLKKLTSNFDWPS